MKDISKPSVKQTKQIFERHFTFNRISCEEVFLEVLFREIHKKTPVPESLFKKFCLRCTLYIACIHAKLLRFCLHWELCLFEYQK